MPVYPLNSCTAPSSKAPSPRTHSSVYSSVHPSTCTRILHPFIYPSIQRSFRPSILHHASIQQIHSSIDPAIYPATYLSIHPSARSFSHRFTHPPAAHPPAQPFLICSSLCGAEADSPLFWKNKSASPVLSPCFVGWRLSQTRPEASWTHSISACGSSLPRPHLPPLVLGRGGSQSPSGR